MMSPLGLLIVGIQVVAIVVAIGLGILVGDESYFTIAVIVGACLTIFCIMRPGFTAYGSVVLFVSGLTAPSIPLQLNFFNVFSGLLIVSGLVQWALGRFPRWRMPATYWWIAAFSAVVLVTILKRGSGLRILGSSTWGGLVYIELFLMIGVSFVMPRMALSPRAWRNALLLMGLLAILPAVSDVIVLGTGRLSVWYFIQGSGQIGMTYVAQETGMGVERLFSAGQAGYYLYFAFLLLTGTRRMLSPLRLPLLCVPVGCVALILLSGHRIMLLQCFLLLFSVMWLQRAINPKTVLVMGCAVLLMVFCAITWIDRLPLPAQRALSFLPGTHVTSVVQKDAEQSLEWRLELWRRVSKLIPRYLVVGKGFAFNGDELRIATDPTQVRDEWEWAIVTGSYHNGPLTLLIGFGVAGLVTGFAFLTGGTLRHIRFARGEWHDVRLQVCHQTVTGLVVTMTLIFIFVYGEIRSIVIPFLFYLGVLEALKRRDNELGAREAADAADAAESGLPEASGLAELPASRP